MESKDSSFVQNSVTIYPWFVPKQLPKSSLNVKWRGKKDILYQCLKGICWRNILFNGIFLIQCCYAYFLISQGIYNLKNPYQRNWIIYTCGYAPLIKNNFPSSGFDSHWEERTQRSVLILNTMINVRHNTQILLNQTSEWYASIGIPSCSW